MNTSPPPRELGDELLATHARRYPQKATVEVFGDGGAPLRLPLLLGTPTGAAKPADPRAFPAWERLLAATLRGKGGAGIAAELARDCLLYPDRGTFATWETRWPALIDSIGSAALRKIGFSSVLRVPGADEEAPGAVAALLAETPAALWRWIDVGPSPVPVVIVPPSRPHWDALQAALAKGTDADCRALFDELVATCCKGDGVGALLVEWPGLALPLENLIVKMAGAAAEVRLGEW